MFVGAALRGRPWRGIQDFQRGSRPLREAETLSMVLDFSEGAATECRPYKFRLSIKTRHKFQSRSEPDERTVHKIC